MPIITALIGVERVFVIYGRQGRWVSSDGHKVDTGQVGVQKFMSFHGRHLFTLPWILYFLLLKPRTSSFGARSAELFIYIFQYFGEYKVGYKSDCFVWVSQHFIHFTYSLYSIECIMSCETLYTRLKIKTPKYRIILISSKIKTSRIKILIPPKIKHTE